MSGVDIVDVWCIDDSDMRFVQMCIGKIAELFNNAVAEGLILNANHHKSRLILQFQYAVGHDWRSR